MNRRATTRAGPGRSLGRLGMTELRHSKRGQARAV